MAQSSGRSVFSQFVDEIDTIPFAFGALVTFVFIGLAAFRTEWVSSQITTAFSVFGEGLAWMYLVAMLVMLIVCVYLMVSPYGRIKLGDEDPEYSNFSYLAMFFSAGLSAGIVFFGPVEALTHYGTVPPLFGGTAEAGTTSAMVPALAYSIFHYGVSAWGGYLAIGIPVAYYAYRRDAPFRTSTVLMPVLGRENLDGIVGRTIDTLAVVATLGGIATGLGFIATQILTGITYRTGIQFGNVETVLAITGITIIFTISLIAGVDRGIRRLSDFNIVLMTILLFATLVGGVVMSSISELAVLNTGALAVGTYIQNFFSMSLFTGVGLEGGTGWTSFWTVFYWSWWIAWAPFVGLFLARISKGRTIREVLFTALVTMTLVSIVWFTIVGGTSMWLQQAGVVDILGAVSQYGDGVAGYALFGALPLGVLWQPLFLILVVTFFATSADSSTLAVAMLTTGGKENPSSLNRLFWGVLQGLIASILVVLGGASALRSSVIITGAPFAIVCVLSLFVFMRELGSDHGAMIFDGNRTWFRSPDSANQSTDVVAEEPTHATDD
ncbi:BCCT family transporter [Haloarcula nitratireducens]|uniref:BCCT family transporter n=1 Tax=Haloarcula nitratireducens TaxID=2487749 RepID=A0AAW4PI23_9EURY|nr:BCCT family transporter [Halomicroarcula nitratireducens]MBX0297085.1 BCCT family transporter [Halomicroarcula nitratireducens]